MLYIEYWKTRQFLLKIIFFFKKIFYRFSNRAILEKNTLKSKRRVFLEVLKRIFINVMVFVLLLWMDGLFISVFENIPTIDSTLVADILIAMVGIAGVFLGLYCSYIATVFSTKYVNAPQEISNLFKDDFINSKSINAITNYIIFSIIMLISNLLFKNLGIVTVTFNMVMAIYMIVSYVYIGKRILGMSNTYFVADNVYRDFFREFKRISKHRMFMNDETFQNHIKKLACNNIELLKLINTYNLEIPENKSASLFNFMYNNLILLYYYLEIKNKIPYNSIWFRIVKYKKWYTASDSELEIALNTGTFLSNSESDDRHWFEREILRINECGLESLINKKEFGLVRQYIGCFEPMLSISIETYDTRYWVEHIQTIQRKIPQIISNKGCTEEDKLALCESLLASYLQFAIDLNKFLQEFNLDMILHNAIEQREFNKYEYFKLFNNSISEKMYIGIVAEEKLEGKRITPDWYIKQYVSKQVYDEFVQFCKSIETINNNIMILADELNANKEYSSATIVYVKYIEWYHRVFLCLELVQNILNQSKANHKETTNFIWEEYDFKKMIEALNNSYSDALSKWSKSAMAFAVVNWDDYDNFPDMLGACYNNICDFLVHTLINNDFDSFEKSYSSLWSIVALYQELIRKELVGIKEPYKQNAVLATLCNPILDFGNISGYAYLWGEISNDDKWKNLITDTFANVIESYKDKQMEICSQISACLYIPRTLVPAIYNRSILHTSWQSLIERAFLSSGYIKWEQKRFHKTIETDSILLKQIIGYRSYGDLIQYDAYEIFGVMVLNNYLPVDKKFKTQSGWEDRVFE